MYVYSTVEMAVKLVVDNFEMNHMTCDTQSILASVHSWYDNSDVADPEILAACVLMGRDWFPEATYQYMLYAKDQWFPQDSYAGTSIWDIEAAQRDMIWY